MGSVIPDICVIFHSAILPSVFSARSQSCLGGGQSGVWNLLATSEGSPSPGKQCLTSGTACQRWDNGHCKCLLNGDNCAGFTARVHACWCGQQVLPYPTEMLSKMKALFPHPQEPIRDRCRHRDISAKAHHHLRSCPLSSASPYPMTGGYEDNNDSLLSVANNWEGYCTPMALRGTAEPSAAAVSQPASLVPLLTEMLPAALSNTLDTYIPTLTPCLIQTKLLS